MNSNMMKKMNKPTITKEINPSINPLLPNQVMEKYFLQDKPKNWKRSSLEVIVRKDGEETISNGSKEVDKVKPFKDI